MATNNNDIKKLLEAFDRTEQWRGDDPNPPGGKLVGETEKFLGDPYIREEEIEEQTPNEIFKDKEAFDREQKKRAANNAETYKDLDKKTSEKWKKLAGEDDLEEYADTFDPEKDADTGVHVRQAAQQAPQPKKQDDPRSLDFTSRQFKGIDALVERLTKAYEDYVSNEKYSDDKVYPKKSQKPTADKKKVKEPKVADPSNLSEEDLTELDGPGAKWRRGVHASGHAPGEKHSLGTGPVGGTYSLERNYDDDKKVPVDKYRGYEDPLKDRRDTKFRMGGDIPLNKKNAERNLKDRIQRDKGKHGPVGKLPESKEKANPVEQANELAASMGVKKALKHALMMANLGRDPSWLPVIRHLSALSKKKEKPFRDAAATGNPRDFANEAKSPSKDQAKKNDAEYSKIVAHWKKLHGNDVQIPGGPAGDQKMRQAWNKSRKKKIGS